jgi:hypothetical protein
MFLSIALIIWNSVENYILSLEALFYCQFMMNHINIGDMRVKSIAFMWCHSYGAYNSIECSTGGKVADFILYHRENL